MNKLFIRYQKELLKLANSKYGRLFLEIPPEFRDKKIVKITPNSFTIVDGSRLRGIFRCYSLYAKKLAAALSSIEILNDLPPYKNLNKYEGLVTYCGLTKNREFPVLLLASSTVYSSAGDGHAKDLNNSSWADARGGPGNSTDSETLTLTRKNADGTYNCGRGFFPFDTSSIGTGASVDTATLNIYGGPTATSNDDSVSIVLVESTQADINTLDVGDFDAVTLNNPDEGASRMSASDWSTSGYNQFTLNSTGISWIDVSGNTKLACRDNRDVDNTAPTGNNKLYCLYSETAGTSQDPYLDITYTPPGGGAFLYNLIFN